MSPSALTSTILAVKGPANFVVSLPAAFSKNADFPWYVPEIGVDPMTVQRTSADTRPKKGLVSPCSQFSKAERMAWQLSSVIPMSTTLDTSEHHVIRLRPSNKPSNSNRTSRQMSAVWWESVDEDLSGIIERCEAGGSSCDTVLG
jgi:hypothetical protein